MERCSTPYSGGCEPPDIHHFMVYGAEAVLPCDIIHDSPRVRMYEEKEAELDRQDNLDALEEERDVAKARSAFYQQQARRDQSREVWAKTYNIGELVLRLPEKKKDKLKPRWEGPFVIDVVLTRGAYRLRNAYRLTPNAVFVSSPLLFNYAPPLFLSFLDPLSIHTKYLIQCGFPDYPGRTMSASCIWGLPIRKLDIITLMAFCPSHMRSFSTCALFSPLYASI